MNIKHSKRGGLTTIQSDEISNKISKLSPESQSNIQQVNDAINEMVDDIFDFDSENRVRKAGYLPSEVEELARYMKSNNIQVGQVFQFGSKSKVLTPFKTVVDVQNYVTALQDRLFEITTVDQELMVSQLKTQVKEFTSLSFFGLIRLAFKKLINSKGE